MFPDVHKRVKKAGKPPGTPIYTGEQKTTPPRITVVSYNPHDFHEATADKLENCLPSPAEPGTTWINVEGLHDVELINQLAKRYQLHPLTVEDILNIEQRSKVEEFDGYIFMTMKMLFWQAKTSTFSIEQLSLVIGKDFLLSFQERNTEIFTMIHERLRGTPNQRLRQQGTDYLAYRLIDVIVDQYFIVLEGLGDQIEAVEEHIITAPTPQNSRTIYRLKRQLVSLRKAIWPMREILSHLLQVDETMITQFTHVYLRDVYDHTVQAIDTLETFRDMLSSMLDVYLSSLTNRMNEIMKVLTVIATFFIPMTFIASVYGMNFKYMPELQWHYGYFIVLSVMLVIGLIMLVYFRRKKWI